LNSIIPNGENVVGDNLNHVNISFSWENVRM
jgi:hypothetical protein